MAKNQNFLGSHDIYSFLFWTFPLVVGLSVSGGAIVNLYLRFNFFFRVLLQLLTSVVIALGWYYFVYFNLGAWILSFSFPVFYIWLISTVVQLIFIDICLPKPIEKSKPTKRLFKLFVFPLVLLTTFLAIKGILYIKSQFSQPEKELYLIPDNFRGPFRVVYGEPSGIVPIYENGRAVLKIPDNRVLIIKPKFQAGTVDNLYFLIDRNGRRSKLDGFYDYRDSLTKLRGILMICSGVTGGAMPDGSFSSESSQAIHYIEYAVINNGKEALNDQAVHQNIDSLTEALVNQCRKTNGK